MTCCNYTSTTRSCANGNRTTKNCDEMMSLKNCCEMTNCRMNDDVPKNCPTSGGDVPKSCRMNGDNAPKRFPTNDGGTPKNCRMNGDDALTSCRMNGDAHDDKTVHPPVIKNSFRYGLWCNRKRKAYPYCCCCCLNYWVGSSLTNTPFTKYL